MSEQDTSKSHNLTSHFRKNVWSILGVIIGLLGIIAAISIFWVDRDVKALQITSLGTTSLITARESVIEDVEILFRGQPVEALSLTQIRLENTGNQAILERDYSRHLAFKFPEDTNVIDFTVIEEQPAGIGIGFRVIDNTSVMSPTLLNPGDRAVFSFIIAGLRADENIPPFTVDARIIGISEIPVASVLENEGTTIWGTTLVGVISLTFSISVVIISARSLVKGVERMRRNLEELERLQREQDTIAEATAEVLANLERTRATAEATAEVLANLKRTRATIAGADEETLKKLLDMDK